MPGLFLTQGCAECKAEREAVERRIALGRSRELSATERRALRRVRYLLVDLDALSQEQADPLLEAFDLSSLPMLLRLDPSGRGAERYITLQ